MSRAYRLLFILISCLFVFGCSCERDDEPSKSEEASSFEQSSLPELEALEFPRTEPHPLLFVDASKDASGLYALEGRGDDEVLRRVDPSVSFDSLIARVLYERVGDDDGDKSRVRIRGVLYTAESAAAWEAPQSTEDMEDARAAEGSQPDKAADSKPQGARTPAGDTPSAPTGGSADLDEQPTVEEVLQRGAFGRQRVLRFNEKGLAEAHVDVSGLDKSSRDLRRSTSFSTYSLGASADSAIVHRAEPAHAVRASMGPDEPPIVFPSGYVVATAASAELEEKGWFIVTSKTLQVLDDKLRVVGVVQDRVSGEPLTNITTASFVSYLGDGGVLVTLKREGAPSELYYLGALQPFTPEQDDAAPTEEAEGGGPAARGARDKDAELPLIDGEEVGPIEAVPPEFQSTANRLENENGEALGMGLLGGSGIALPAAHHRVLRNDALYFAYGPSAVSGQWTSIYRANRDGWTVFDHKTAAGFSPDEAVWGARRSALSPFIFDAGERGLFLSLGEEAVYMDVSARKGSEWTLSPLETPLPKLKAAVTSHVSDGWVYLNGSHRQRLRGPSTEYAVALNLHDGKALVLEGTRWLGAVSDGRYLRPFRPELLCVSAMIGLDGDGQLFAVSASTPEAGRVTLGTAPEGTKEIQFFGISIGPLRLLQLIDDEGSVQIAVVDVREPNSLRVISEQATEGWTLKSMREAEAEEFAIPAKATRPLAGF